MSAALRKAICNIGGKLDRARDRLRNADLDDTGMREAYELIIVLARIVDGVDMRKAFGAPGDWGYDTELGQSVWGLHKPPAQTPSATELEEVSTQPTSPAPEYSDLAAARAAHLKLGPDYVLVGGIDKPYRLLHCSTLPTYDLPAPAATDLPSAFVVEIDPGLDAITIVTMLRRAGMKLVNRGENRPYLLTSIGFKSTLNQDAAHEIANDDLNERAALIRRRRGEYTRAEVDAGINASLERGFE